MEHTTQSVSHPWAAWKRHGFRFVFIALLLFIIPIDGKFYQKLFSINWADATFYDLLVLTKYQPQFFPPEQPWGQYLEFVNFRNWLLVALIALVGATIWGVSDRGRRQAYPRLYYWSRVLVRYRLALGLIAYGIYKVFQLQLPYPPLSNLLTNYGDFYAWKIYYQTTGISPNYETFLGAVELLAGILILYRRTVTFGAGLALGFLGNITAVNFYYGLGEASYSLLLTLFAAYLFVHDVPRLYQLLIEEKPALAEQSTSALSGNTLILKRTAQFLVLVFVVGICVKAYGGRHPAAYKLPQTRGLTGAAGRYLVTEFVVNGDTIPYSRSHPFRWQEAVFEEWSTLSIKSNRPVTIDKSNGEGYHEKDIDRNYELAGISGRHFYHYEQDTVRQQLRLQNKNIHHRGEQFVLDYQRPTDSTIVLNGRLSPDDSVRVVLKRIDKKYMMYEGRRRPVKI